MDVYVSDPVIGQYILEVKQKGNNPFRQVFQAYKDYGFKPGYIPPTDEQFAAKNQIVLLNPDEIFAMPWSSQKVGRN